MTETVVCVGAVVHRAGQLLLVRQSPGHPLAGHWTIPWGQIDRGESPTAAVLREVREEAGLDVAVEGFLGLQELPDPWLGMLGLLFLCRHVDGEPVPDHRETDAAQYFGVDQVGSVSEPVEPLSAWIAERFFNRQLSLLRDNGQAPFAPSPSYL